jgi:hypothetical protein
MARIKKTQAFDWRLKNETGSTLDAGNKEKSIATNEETWPVRSCRADGETSNGVLY